MSGFINKGFHKEKISQRNGFDLHGGVYGSNVIKGGYRRRKRTARHAGRSFQRVVRKVEARLKQDFTFYYFICIGQQKAGAVRVVDRKETGKNKRISPIFILPEFQGKGIAQKAIRLCEEMHGSGNWELDTILQEPKNCHLYEKMGYRQTGRTQVINERLTLTFYEKKEAGRK